MNQRSKAEQREPAHELSLYCSVVGDAWRVHVRPAGLPRYLRALFDMHYEAYPVLLDFDDLERHMSSSGTPYEKHITKTGSVELLAQGPAAESLGVWLSTAFSSGIRPGTR